MTLTDLIGKPISMAEAIMATYRFKDFTCAKDARRDEIIAFTGLPLLRIAGPHPMQAAYEGVGVLPGWLEVGLVPDQQKSIWRAVTLGTPAQPGAR